MSNYTPLGDVSRFAVSQERVLQIQKNRQLSLQTNKRRRALASKLVLEQEKEEERRKRILEERRLKQREATEKFQRFFLKKKKFSDRIKSAPSLQRRFSPAGVTLDSALKLVRGSPSFVKSSSANLQESQISRNISSTENTNKHKSSLLNGLKANANPLIEKSRTHTAWEQPISIYGDVPISNLSASVEKKLRKEQSRLLELQRESLNILNSSIQTEIERDVTRRETVPITPAELDTIRHLSESVSSLDSLDATDKGNSTYRAGDERIVFSNNRPTSSRDGKKVHTLIEGTCNRHQTNEKVISTIGTALDESKAFFVPITKNEYRKTNTTCQPQDPLTLDDASSCGSPANTLDVVADRKPIQSFRISHATSADSKRTATPTAVVAPNQHISIKHLQKEGEFKDDVKLPEQNSKERHQSKPIDVRANTRTSYEIFDSEATKRILSKSRLQNVPSPPSYYKAVYGDITFSRVPTSTETVVGFAMRPSEQPSDIEGTFREEWSGRNPCLGKHDNSLFTGSNTESNRVADFLNDSLKVNKETTAAQQPHPADPKFTDKVFSTESESIHELGSDVNRSKPIPHTTNDSIPVHLYEEYQYPNQTPKHRKELLVNGSDNVSEIGLRTVEQKDKKIRLNTGPDVTQQFTEEQTRSPINDVVVTEDIPVNSNTPICSKQKAKSPPRSILKHSPSNDSLMIVGDKFSQSKNNLPNKTILIHSSSINVHQLQETASQAKPRAISTSEIEKKPGSRKNVRFAEMVNSPLSEHYEVHKNHETESAPTENHYDDVATDHRKPRPYSAHVPARTTTYVDSYSQLLKNSKKPRVKSAKVQIERIGFDNLKQFNNQADTEKNSDKLTTFEAKPPNKAHVDHPIHQESPRQNIYQPISSSDSRKTTLRYEDFTLDESSSLSVPERPKDPNKIRLDKTPTDDEIDWLWQNMQTFLKHSKTKSRLPLSSGFSPAATKSPGAGRSTIDRTGGLFNQNGNARRGVGKDPKHFHGASILDRERQQNRPLSTVVRSDREENNKGPSQSGSFFLTEQIPGDANGVAENSTDFFARAEKLVDQPQLSESQIDRRLRSKQETGKPRSNLSIEESNLLQSLDRLDERLRVLNGSSSPRQIAPSSAIHIPSSQAQKRTRPLTAKNRHLPRT